LHVITTKGKGLKQAEEDQVKYHAPGKFNATTGELIEKDTKKLPPKYQDVFGYTIVELAKENPNIVGITPAMPTGSSLKYMMETFPERAIDVGIAEQHAVTLAAGMATQGLVPFCNIYSTFLQRAYDQVIHDVALQNLPVIFCLDRAGIVGEDGATHHGVFDLAYLRCIPNMIVFAPMNEAELRNILFTAQEGLKHPIAIRYPRGRGVTINWRNSFKKIKMGTSRIIKEGNAVAILSIGHIGNIVAQAIEEAHQPQEVGHFDMRFVKPLDEKQLHRIFSTYKSIITVEDGCLEGGFGSAVLEFAFTNNYKPPVKRIGIPDVFIEHGCIEELHKIAKIDKETIKQTINNQLTKIY
jgi:1-deoxy-D-xylulose-5-phosphate synthase